MFFHADQMLENDPLKLVCTVNTLKYVHISISSPHRITQIHLANPLVPGRGTESYFRKISLKFECSTTIGSYRHVTVGVSSYSLKAAISHISHIV